MNLISLIKQTAIQKQAIQELGWNSIPLMFDSCRFQFRLIVCCCLICRNSMRQNTLPAIKPNNQLNLAALNQLILSVIIAVHTPIVIITDNRYIPALITVLL